MNNIMDKWFIVVGSILCAVIYYGIVMSFFTVEELAQGSKSYIASFSFSTIIVILFMYMNKRIHKEVFLEIKQRVSS